MGYEALETEIATPTAYLLQFCQHHPDCTTAFFQAAGRWKTVHGGQGYMLALQWNLTGTVEWGLEFIQPSESTVKEDKSAISLRVTNEGTLTCTPSSPQKSRLCVEVQFAPLPQKELWEAYCHLFSAPGLQIKKDLERLREKIEAAYLQECINPAQPNLSSRLGLPNRSEWGLEPSAA